MHSGSTDRHRSAERGQVDAEGEREEGYRVIDEKKRLAARGLSSSAGRPRAFGSPPRGCGGRPKNSGRRRKRPGR